MSTEQKNKNVFFNAWYYILIILIFGVITFLNNKTVGAAQIGAAVILALISYFVKSRKQIKILKMLEQDIVNTEFQTKNSIMHFP